MIVNALESPKADSPHTASAYAPAKINLTLEIMGRRSDGYHDLRSLVIGVDLCDRVHCAVTSQSGLTVECSDPALCTQENLTVRAARELARRCGCDPDLTIRLEKRIPVGAGLGGGSSDAAATLRLCNRLFRTGLDDAELLSIGAEIGSDVPLFFHLPGAVITGRGERVQPVQMRWKGWVLLILPDIHVSTAQVYSAWRPDDALPVRHATEEEITRCSTASDLSASLSNHLEPAVFRVCPSVARLFEEINEIGLGSLRVSGSGSAMYLLYDDPEAARHAAETIENRFPHLRTEVVSAPAEERFLLSEDH